MRLENNTIYKNCHKPRIISDDTSYKKVVFYAAGNML